MDETLRKPYDQRLSYIAGLKDGWFKEGEGRAPSLAAIAYARALLDRLNLNTNFGVYPMGDGGIQFELHSTKCVISLEIPYSADSEHAQINVAMSSADVDVEVRVKVQAIDRVAKWWERLSIVQE
jgi:hypothetical protein